MRYKAVIFDLDGTLLDTIDDLADSMNRVLQKSNLPVHDVEAYKNFVGNGIKKMVIRALPPEYRDEIQADVFTSQMMEEYAQNWCIKTKYYHGIPELLDTLSGMNIKMAILSNKAQEFTQAISAKYFSRWQFEAVIGERPFVPRKPDPTSALEIAHKFGVSPQQFLYLGDSGTDMKTATAAGMFPVGASWGFRSIDELSKYGAERIIDNPIRLLDFFNQ